MGAAYLVRHGIPEEEAPTQAEILVTEALHISPGRLLLEQHRQATENEREQLRTFFLRCARGEPIQYIIGEWPFHNITLKTDARALIPRPETEQLVEHILHSEEWKLATSIVDIGTGTGAIILSLAKADTSGTRQFHAIDISPDALALAQENATRLGLSHRVTFELANGASTLPQRSVDILVSNPPYISTADTDALPPLILANEPRTALDGGEDGLQIIRQIILDATLALKPNGAIFLEIGDEQGLSVKRLLDCAGYSDVTISKDYAHHDRYAYGRIIG
jgi:release factor glutamine methyltransferase